MRNWIGVASAEHVRDGRAEGFMQLCHGKAAPLRRIAAGDRMIYYSPTVTFRGRDKLHAFTAIGMVAAGEPYPLDMGGGFCPFRRKVDWLPGTEAPIQPLLPKLEFVSGGRNWGYKLRFGLFQVSDHDAEVIAAAMGATRQASVEAPDRDGLRIAFDR